jgi:hypothetical protein
MGGPNLTDQDLRTAVYQAGKSEIGTSVSVLLVPPSETGGFTFDARPLAWITYPDESDGWTAEPVKVRRI